MATDTNATNTPARVRFTDAESIKRAVRAGVNVCWKSNSYSVVEDSLGQWFIRCVFNGHAIGLTWADGVTLNGKPEDFYVPTTFAENRA